MKIFPIKLPFILLIIFCVTGMALSNCGQQTEVKTSTDTIDTTNAKTVINDTVANNLLVINDTAKTQQKVNSNTTIKEKDPAAKTTVEQQVISTPKTAPATNTTPATKPATAPPPVVIVKEPVKPAPETRPAPIDAPKPVTVITPTPAPAPAPVQTNWPVPASYKSMKNPYPADKESIDLGKSLYGTHCKSCHGSKGDGQGTKAATLETEIRSFMSAGFRAQLPGEVYYKFIIGRKDMPKFDKKITDEEERWAVVNYIMSL